jgi:unsaturated rhamnogalacturonyl hydrolase
MLFLITPAQAQTTLPDAAAVVEVIQRANAYWISNNTAGNAGWARSAYYTGNQRACRVLGNHTFHNWAVAWGNLNQWKIGPEGATHADAHCCGQTYVDLYQLDGRSHYLADIQVKMDALVATNRVDYWWWIDAFYMAGPTLAKLGSLTGDTNYFEKLWLLYDDMKTRRGLYDGAESLWFRDASYFYPGTQSASGQKVFWSRGNGWVFAGLARVMQEMPTNAPHYADYAGMFQDMAAQLRTIQGSDGMWRASLYDAAQYPNPETSGTGFFTCGMAWGVRSGLLPAADYTNTIALAWHGLTNLALNANGRVGYVQNVGAGPAAATVSNTTDFGVGAFLLACSELYLLAADAPGLSPWAGPDRTLVDVEDDGLESVVLDASDTEFYSAMATNYSWWLGDTAIATGVSNLVNLPLGQHEVTVKISGSDGILYSNTATVSIVSPASFAPVLKLRFDFEAAGAVAVDSVAGVALNLLNGAGQATDLHGPSGSGVAGMGRALDFTSAASQGGTGPIAVTTNNAGMSLGPVSNFTVSLWIKPAATLLTGGFPRFFSLGTNGTTDRATASSLQLLSNGNLAPTAACQGFVNTATATSGAMNLPTNAWSFLALVYDGAALQFYAGFETNPVVLISSATLPAGTVNLAGANSLFLGNRLSRDRAFRGWMDDVRFHTGIASLEYLESVRKSVVAPPVAYAALAGSQLQISVAARLGFTHVLEASANLTAPVIWTPMATNLGMGGMLTNTVEVNPQQPAGFFRYQLMP